MEQNELMVAEAAYIPEEKKMMDSILSGQDYSYCSIHPESMEDRARLYNIKNSSPLRLKDFVNKTLYITDVFIQPVVCKKDDGSDELAPRIVLIDKDSQGYACVSFGILGAVKSLMRDFGEPTWKTPLPIVPLLKSKGDRSFLTVELDMKAF